MTATSRISRSGMVGLWLAAAMLLAGCSSSAVASSDSVDYGRAEQAATLEFTHRSTVLEGASDKTVLEFVKAYCDGVAKQGVKAQNRDSLLTASAPMVDAWQKAASLYCPVTMRVAG